MSTQLEKFEEVLSSTHTTMNKIDWNYLEIEKIKAALDYIKSQCDIFDDLTFVNLSIDHDSYEVNVPHLTLIRMLNTTLETMEARLDREIRNLEHYSNLLYELRELSE